MDIVGDFDSESWSIFSITENMSSSYVDTNKLLFDESYQQNKFPIGMANFRSKQQKTSLNNSPFTNCQKNLLFNHTNDTTVGNIARQRWKAAANKVKFMIDPWCEFKLEAYPSENAIRHRYNAIKKQWIKDECIVKIEPDQFSNGAMRACFRLKKLSKLVHTTSWEHASNYVAKSYIDSDMPRERYFDDVKLQMDAKLWAELYNRYNPPKKIDMFQVSILEFRDRPGSPLYHLEHFIDGKYIKYNSNSGFVEDVHVRNTPQAFSHFTFERSNHELIVVDIQGVGDLYTDPQIHTAKGTEYGEGNLGVKGFALFFSSHICNDVCRSLGLSQFDLVPSESKSHIKPFNQSQKMTKSRGVEELVAGSPSSYGEYFRHRFRTVSSTSGCSDENSVSNDLFDIDESEGYESSSSPLSPDTNSNSSYSIPFPINRTRDNGNRTNGGVLSNPILIPSISQSPMQSIPKFGRIRNESYCLDSAFTNDEAVNFFNSRNFNKPRPSCVHAEKYYISNRLDENNENDEDECFRSIRSRSDSLEEEDSILGRIHLELCKYHEMGRFLVNENDDFNEEAAFFHLKQSANLGVIEALINLAKIYLQLPHDILPSYQVEALDINYDIGFEYMFQSAEKGDKYSMYFVAKSFDTGISLSKNKQINWLKSLEYYQRVINKSSNDDEILEPSIDCDPSYIILARMAEMNLSGGNGLDKDPSEAASLFTEAAEKAMLFGKGRLANKYYQMSEEASALADEEDFS